jgi:phosphotransferase system IIB component
METVKDKGAAETPMAEQNGTNGVAPLGENPLTHVIGGFADDPLWDEFIEEMEQSRREMDRKHGLVE